MGHSPRALSLFHFRLACNYQSHIWRLDQGPRNESAGDYSPGLYRNIADVAWRGSDGGRIRLCQHRLKLDALRRLKIRYEHRADIHLAFLQLGCALISLRFLG